MFAGKEDFKIAYEAKALETFAKPVSECSTFEKYELMVFLISSTTAKVRTQTSQRHIRLQQKKIHYFSMEFLIGRLLKSYLINLDMEELVREGLNDLNIDLDTLCACERDPGLGNGGLGRLAAAFWIPWPIWESPAWVWASATASACSVSGSKTAIRPRSRTVGWKTAIPGRRRSPTRPFPYSLAAGWNNLKPGPGHYRYALRDTQTVLAVPYDVPIVGYGGKTVNVLRLWSAEPVVEKLDLAAFNHGDYSGAMPGAQRDRGHHLHSLSR